MLPRVCSPPSADRERYLRWDAALVSLSGLATVAAALSSIEGCSKNSSRYFFLLHAKNRTPRETRVVASVKLK